MNQTVNDLFADREHDPQVRMRKTTLTNELNAAYERKDLSTLLRIQLQAEMMGAIEAAAVSETRLTALCDLLAEQVNALKMEMDAMHLRRGMEFDLDYLACGPFSEAELLATLLAQRECVQKDVPECA
ncbi:hypothetical protein [Actimicrobium sp. CCI2.3]|uniref:hypothetical protein n=1 Tax=Actimicrobium sp. CCI2.3 TaxID=3048616 RepID=UPI002AB3C721|nr:hypothetical protein [Actimicrobium sp. CCI2.3]MDY7574209.1 hypothetical protein [Actimicrobium sp. CCI2.3]MEB0023866.1 hypothetical protein [Actimicrobium sp. CCI2.3]